eukprot:CAMPEP_0170481814 /NCGR_PEP_ID=MMETSP0208-20121228/2111_1 /TAXON_ID=197538 /ORGANISM="Strombidium inclinatum, Strain S3" /LENGTH=118 /DNA_ID=CAMNT_0010754585 /DNA_START=58 /DNA_END=414 /DNA_ORIENTATION=+
MARGEHRELAANATAASHKATTTKKPAAETEDASDDDDPSENESDPPANEGEDEQEEETDEEREARLAAEREKEDSETLKKFKGEFDSSDDFNPKEVDSQFGIQSYYKSGDNNFGEMY